MRQAKLTKSGNPWRLSGLRGMDYQELSSTLDQILSDPTFPGRLLLLDLGELYSENDLRDEGIRQLLFQKL